MVPFAQRLSGRLPILILLMILSFQLAALTGASPSLSAQERRLVAYVDRAVAAYRQKAISAGSERRLLAEFSQVKGPWVEGELYLYVYDLQGNCLAHGYRNDLIGRNLLGLQDSEGVFMIKDILTALKTNDSWWENFRFPNPVKNNKISPKRSFNRLVPSAWHPGGVMIGSGFYEGD